MTSPESLIRPSPDYLILGHDRPDRLERLVRRLDGHGSRFFVHFDRRAAPHLWNELCDRLCGTDTTMLPRHAGAWGRYGIVAATVEGLRAYVRSGGGRHLVMLSGSDYPVKTTESIEKHLTGAVGYSFARTWSIPLGGWAYGGGLGRFDRWYFGRRFPLPPARMVPPGRGPRRLPCDLRPYGGWQWMTYDRDAARWIVAYLAAHPRVERFFRWTKIPDEVMLQTLLMNSPLALRVRDSLHHIDWSGGGRHPRTLDADDVADLVDGPSFFARKFDDASVLDAIDRRLGVERIVP